MSNSYFLNLKNNLFLRCQNSNFAKIISESFLFSQIDKAIFIALLGIFASAPFFSTSVIGAFSILFIFLILLKLCVKKGEILSPLTVLDGAIIIFLALSILSLMGSTLFILSLKGFLKVLIYICFYFCFSHWLKTNKGKLPLILTLIGALVCFESVVAILQNFSGVEEISGWQDCANLDAHEVISRSYGTLKPFNPNLLAGYLLGGLSILFYFMGNNILSTQKKRGTIFGILIILNIIALILTGCRGAYLGLIAFFATGAYALLFYVNNYFGGLSKIKKRYKYLFGAIIAGFCTYILTNPAIFKRILSIFAFREDSSISFRLNVYKSSFQMFLDNPIIGIGLGNQNFRETYGLYMRTGFDALGTYCVPLEIAVEMGILGLISFLAILYFAYFPSIKFLIQSNDIRKKLLIFSMLMLILLLMTHGLIDTIFYRPQVQMLFWFALGVINVFSLQNLKPLQK